MLPDFLKLSLQIVTLNFVRLKFSYIELDNKLLGLLNFSLLALLHLGSFTHKTSKKEKRKKPSFKNSGSVSQL